MSEYVRTVALRLRFVAEELDLEEISEATGLVPDFHCKKGDLIKRPNGSLHKARVDQWRKSCDPHGGEETDLHIRWMLSSGNSDLAGWRQVSARYCGQLLVGMLMHKPGGIVMIQPETILMVADRGLEADLDQWSNIP